MTTDAIGLLVGSVIVGCLSLLGVVLMSRSTFQSAAMDTIVKQYQTVSRENIDLRTERDQALADVAKWKSAFEACEKRLPTERRRRASRDGDN